MFRMILRNRFAIIWGYIAVFSLLLPLHDGYGQNKERDTQKLNTRLSDINSFFASVMANPQTAIPQAVMGNAKGIIVVMRAKGGRFSARRGGSGIVIVRDERTGKLGVPSFILSQDENWGLVVAGKTVDSIYLLMDSDGLSILSENRFRIGSGVKAAVGPTTAQPDVQVDTSILVYSGTSGSVPGTYYSGGILYGEITSNRLYYNDESITMQDILFNYSGDPTAEILNFVQLVDKYVGDFKVVKKKRIGSIIF